MNIIVARIAAALGKTRAAHAWNVEEIAEDALALAWLTHAAREVLVKQAASAQPTSGRRDVVSRQMPVEKLASEAQEIADRYGAKIVSEANPDTFVFGLQFRDGSFSGPMRSIFAIM